MSAGREASPSPTHLPPIAPQRPQRRLPEGTCDCHFHIFPPGYPLAFPRDYTPHPVSLSQWRLMAAALGIDLGVLVQPSVYGTDNSALLDALAQGGDKLRAIAVLDPATPDPVLMDMDRAGVRGARINLKNSGGPSLAESARLAARLNEIGWHIELQVLPDQLEPASRALKPSRATCVLDHAAFMPVRDAARLERHLAQLERLLDTGNYHIKISAPYRLAPMPHYPGFGSLVKRLLERHAQRVLWGSDWPHTELGEAMPSDADLASKAVEWLAEGRNLRQVMVDNPRRLYWRR